MPRTSHFATLFIIYRLPLIWIVSLSWRHVTLSLMSLNSIMQRFLDLGHAFGGTKRSDRILRPGRRPSNSRTVDFLMLVRSNRPGECGSDPRMSGDVFSNGRGMFHDQNRCMHIGDLYQRGTW